MPNLVGIGNSQAPTNAMLGGLAYQDSVGEIDIEKIKARTSDNAVDIFVYDTRNDSDGGAWRKKATKQSWYNEGVSQYRGARKEFPTVAVIVVTDNSNSTSSTTVIYDGDDPNLPMWMKWERDTTQDPFFDYSTPGSNHLGNYEPRSVSALNGIICVGTWRSAGALSNLNAGLREFHFIEDACYASNDDKRVKFPTSIADRDVVTTGYNQVSPNTPIVNSNVNDVAMTVLPNAPIDASTELPVPTIAVATDGGVSVIRDDGTVVSKTTTQLNSSTLASTYFHKNIDISGENAVVNYEYTYTGGYAQLMVVTLDNLTVLRRYGRDYTNTSSHPYFNSGTIHRHFPKQIYKNNHIFTREQKDSDPAGSSNGILTIFEDQTSPSKGLVNRISSSYNTGYMVGNIKGAFLSDTDDTDLGTNLLTVGTFDSASGWTLSGTGAFSISGGKLNGNGTSGASFAQRAETPAIITSGLTYTVKAVVTRTSGNLYARVANSSYSVNIGSTGTHYISLTAGNVPTETVLFYSDGFNGTIDDVEVYIEDQDRSPTGKGLQVFGTKIEKHAVATGAELVGYRPDSSSLGDNYLRLPLTSSIFDLTGDWSISFWAKNNGNPAVNYSGFEISPDDISSNNAYSLIPLSMYIQGDGFIGLRGMNGNANQDATGYPLGIVGDWRCFTIVHRSGTTYLYIDGKLATSKSVSYTNPTSAYSLFIFRWTYSTTRHDGRRHIDFSLFRMSETAPTVEQVKKMYDDEKCLFHENAKCTLHGTSDAVTGLAFDDTNDVLHAGTSSGRSDFRGLNRINNTTTAVTTAISASNELVAEQ